MKKVLFYSLFLIFGLSACVPGGDSTIVFPEDKENKLPEIFQNTWYAAIKCQNAEDPALFITFTTKSNSNTFVAEGDGYDYDGTTHIKFTINGVFNSNSNSLKASITYNFTEIDTYRRDSLTIYFNTYNYNSYIPMNKYYETPGYEGGCESAILISKTKLEYYKWKWQK